MAKFISHDEQGFAAEQAILISQWLNIGPAYCLCLPYAHCCLVPHSEMQDEADSTSQSPWEFTVMADTEGGALLNGNWLLKTLA
jgi:hypothetical protein